MARKTERLVVDGQAYEVTQLGATDGLRLYNELLRCIGPTLGDIDLKGATLESLALVVIAKAIGAIPPDLLIRLGATLAKHCKIVTDANGNEILVDLNEGMYENHFAGRIGHWTRWAVACLRFNYSDFFPASGRSAKNAGAPAPIASS